MPREPWRGAAPGALGAGVMVQEGQRQSELGGIDAVEAGAAEHRVDAMMPDIGPDAVPEQFDGLLVAIGRQHAGAAKLKEAQSAMPGDHRRQIELALGVEAAEPRRRILAHQPVGADDARLDAAEAPARRMVDDQQMVASLVETVGIAAEHARDDAGLRRHFLIEHPVAQALGPPDLARTARQPHFERAAATERAAQRLLSQVAEAEAAGHQHHRREAGQKGLPCQWLICRLQNIDGLRRHASVRPAALPSSRCCDTATLASLF